MAPRDESDLERGETAPRYTARDVDVDELEGIPNTELTYVELQAKAAQYGLRMNLSAEVLIIDLNRLEKRDAQSSCAELFAFPTKPPLEHFLRRKQQKIQKERTKQKIRAVVLIVMACLFVLALIA